jgi:virulence factor Mce-like protein
MLVAAWLLPRGASGDPSPPYRLAAIFDNANFLSPGQDVRIGGAKVGRVTAIHVTGDFKARVELEIDAPAGPFHADADCTIAPQSLIGERFVACTPGSARAAVLRAGATGAATLPVTRTHSSVDLDLVLSTFRASTTQRLRLALNELGAGVGARAEDLAAIIHRANPALANVRDVLDTLAEQRRRLAPLVTNAERTVRSLAKDDGLARFVSRSAGVAAITARRQADLRNAIAGLPGLLAELRPTLRATDDLFAVGTPILADARRAAPQLDALVRHLGPLSASGAPAFAALTRAAHTGTRTLRDARPVARRLTGFAARAVPVGRQLATLFTNMRAKGVVEGLHAFVFYATAVVARFDAEAHIVVAEGVVPSGCILYTSVPSPACSARFNSTGSSARKPAARVRPRPDRRKATRPQDSPGRPTPPADPAPASPALAPTTASPPAPQTLSDLLGGLLGPPGAAPPRQSQAPTSVDSLLGYLLG